MSQSAVVNIRDFIIEGVQSAVTLLRLPVLGGRPSPVPFTSREELVILGNGPSLKLFLENHSDALKGKETMAVNMFVHTEAFDKIKPEYYVFNTPEFWLPDVDDVYKEKSRNFFETLARKTKHPMFFFIPVGAKRYRFWQDILKENPHLKIRFFNTVPVEGYTWFRHFLYDNHLGMPRPHNVLIPSLMLAVWMKKKRVYLTGADHNWFKELFVAGDNTVYLTQKHFYDAQTAKPETMNYLGKGRRKMYQILEKWYYAFRSYHDIEAYARKRGVGIVNWTPGSFIDAFEREKLA